MVGFHLQRSYGVRPMELMARMAMEVTVLTEMVPILVMEEILDRMLNGLR